MTKFDKCLELLRQGVLPEQVKEIVRCHRSTVWRAIQVVEKEKAEGRAQPPSVEVEEKAIPPEELPPLEEEEEELPAEAPSIEEEEAPEVGVPIPELPPELTKEEFKVFIEAVCGTDTLGERYGFEASQVNTLAKLWFPVVTRHWGVFVEKWGLEAFAILGTILIALPKIRLVIEDIRQLMKVERRPKKEGEEERSSKREGF